MKNQEKSQKKGQVKGQGQKKRAPEPNRTRVRPLALIARQTGGLNPLSDGYKVVTIGNHFPIRDSVHAYRELWEEDSKEGSYFREVIDQIKHQRCAIWFLYSGTGSKAEHTATSLLPLILNTLGKQVHFVTPHKQTLPKEEKETTPITHKRPEKHEPPKSIESNRCPDGPDWDERWRMVMKD